MGATKTGRVPLGKQKGASLGGLGGRAAIAAVAATLGALPPREAAFNSRAENRTRSFTTARGEHRLTHRGEPDQALVQWVWPTTDEIKNLRHYGENKEIN